MQLAERQLRRPRRCGRALRRNLDRHQSSRPWGRPKWSAEECWPCPHRLVAETPLRALDRRIYSFEKCAKFKRVTANKHARVLPSP